MRCGCPSCGAFMVHADREESCCVCPDCGYKCNACLGTNTVVSRELLKNDAMQEELLRRLARAEDSEEQEEDPYAY